MAKLDEQIAKCHELRGTGPGREFMALLTMARDDQKDTAIATNDQGERERAVGATRRLDYLIEAIEREPFTPKK